MKLETLAKMQIDYQPESFKCVSVYDDAIDYKKSNVQEYYRTRNLKHIVFKEGTSPTFFYLRLLPLRLTAFLQKTTDTNAIGSIINFFQFCIEKIENFKINGQTIPLWEADDPFKWNDKMIPIISDAELEANFFSYPLIIEIGSVAAARHFLVHGTDLMLAVPESLAQFIQDQMKTG